MILFVLLVGMPLAAADDAPQDDDVPVQSSRTELTSRWTMLHSPSRRRGAVPIPEDSLVQLLPELRFTGDSNKNPYLLGEFVADGEWQVVNGGLQLTKGKNAALRLANVVDFDLEAKMTMRGLGGCFLIWGWGEEKGSAYCLGNVQFKESSSPWHISEFSAGEVVEGSLDEIRHHAWKDTQTLKMTVKDKHVTLKIGTAPILEDEELVGYEGGEIIFGVYDNKYGPRPVRIESIRIRAVE